MDELALGVLRQTADTEQVGQLHAALEVPNGLLLVHGEVHGDFLLEEAVDDRFLNLAHVGLVVVLAVAGLNGVAFNGGLQLGDGGRQTAEDVVLTNIGQGGAQGADTLDNEFVVGAVDALHEALNGVAAAIGHGALVSARRVGVDDEGVTRLPHVHVVNHKLVGGAGASHISGGYGVAGLTGADFPTTGFPTLAALIVGDAAGEGVDGSVLRTNLDNLFVEVFLNVSSLYNAGAGCGCAHNGGAVHYALGRAGGNALGDLG